MNIQVHEAACACSYELVFGQKPRSVLVLVIKHTGVILEEDLEEARVICGDENEEATFSTRHELLDKHGRSDEVKICGKRNDAENEGKMITYEHHHNKAIKLKTN